MHLNCTLFKSSGIKNIAHTYTYVEEIGSFGVMDFLGGHIKVRRTTHTEQFIDFY